MKLSILICSLQSRSGLLTTLLNHLAAQQTDEVEIIVNVDNKEKTTGAKRQELLEKAQGDYVVFVDDDDWIPDYYILFMLKFCATGMDCAAINGTMTTNGINEVAWRLSKDYENRTIKEHGKIVYLRKTNHITAVKRELALLAGFPNISNAEDGIYSKRLSPFLKTEYVIQPKMYEYRFLTTNKEYK